MTESNLEKKTPDESKPLQNIISIEQSLSLMQHKLWQMNKRKSQNVKQIDQVLYSSIPILKSKLFQSFQYQKLQQKKRNISNQNVLKQKTKINRQRKMINQKEIERNRQLISMMKINEHNAMKKMSKKNDIYVEKMKNERVELNRRKKEQIKEKIKDSCLKVQEFKRIKLEQIRRQKEEQSMIQQQKMNQMISEMGRLANKQNQTSQKVNNTEEVLRQLRFAIDRMQKMNEHEFIKLKNHIKIENPVMNEQKILQKILLTIIENNKSKTPNKLAQRTLNSRWSSSHLSRIA